MVSSARQASTSGTADAVPGAADVGALVGNYYNEDLDVIYRVVRTGDGLLALVIPHHAPIQLVATEANVFRAAGAGGLTLRFERANATAPASGATIRFPRIGEMHLIRR